MQNGEQAFHHHTTSAPSGSIICNSSIALITPSHTDPDSLTL